MTHLADVRAQVKGKGLGHMVCYQVETPCSLVCLFQNECVSDLRKPDTSVQQMTPPPSPHPISLIVLIVKFTEQYKNKIYREILFILI